MRREEEIGERGRQRRGVGHLGVNGKGLPTAGAGQRLQKKDSSPAS
jgi:hypothetical protein